MLVPQLSSETYFVTEDIEKCEDSSLRAFPATQPYVKDMGEQLFAGFDVGKKRHPSHLVIFSRKGELIKQVHQSWLDGWSYSDQIVFLNEVAQNFDLDKGYIDNTRGELEDRGLHRSWWPMHFTLKSKNTMAHIFEEFVHADKLRILKDERQKQQILSVNNELKAPVTPMGHGDAFFSIAMALNAAYETSIDRMVMIDNVQDWVSDLNADDTSDENEQIKLTGPSTDSLTTEPTTQYNESINSDLTMADSPNPACTDGLCRPSFWVPENNLCIFCGFRG